MYFDYRLLNSILPATNIWDIFLPVYCLKTSGLSMAVGFDSGVDLS